MQRLRTQVDRIDLQILRLLQQRTKIARRIGETKRRHGAVIYVPERERELLQKINQRSGRRLPPRAVTAIFREILSSSRAAQGQGGIGVLRSSADLILSHAHGAFGACDDFESVATWRDLMKRLTGRKLGLALLTGADLARILSGPDRATFLKHLAIVSDFEPGEGRSSDPGRRIYTVTPRGMHPPARADRAVILIECKLTELAVKTWLNSMPKRLIQIETLPLRTAGGARGASALIRLASSNFRKIAESERLLKQAGIPFIGLGLYRNPEDHAG
jgi:chorismate mutase